MQHQQQQPIQRQWLHIYDNIREGQSKYFASHSRHNAFHMVMVTVALLWSISGNFLYSFQRCVCRCVMCAGIELKITFACYGVRKNFQYFRNIGYASECKNSSTFTREHACHDLEKSQRRFRQLLGCPSGYALSTAIAVGGTFL